MTRRPRYCFARPSGVSDGAPQTLARDGGEASTITLGAFLLRRKSGSDAAARVGRLATLAFANARRSAPLQSSGAMGGLDQSAAVFLLTPVHTIRV
jgi:hypothetical protein